jgi:hypothetical protein
MKSILTERTAAYGILFILLPMIGFHLFVLTGMIPFTIVWGGRLHSHEEMVRFETISIFFLLTMSFIVAVKARIVPLKINQLAMRIALSVMAALFLLNTLGNLTAVTHLERNVFTPATLLLCIFCLRLALAKRAGEKVN